MTLREGGDNEGAVRADEERHSEIRVIESSVKKQAFLMPAGVTLVLVGLTLAIIGILGLTVPIPCAINGCPPIFSANYAVEWTEILIGLPLSLPAVRW